MKYPQQPQAHTSRERFHGRMDVKNFLMIIVAENTEVFFTYRSRTAMMSGKYPHKGRPAAQNDRGDPTKLRAHRPRPVAQETSGARIQNSYDWKVGSKSTSLINTEFPKQERGLCLYLYGYTADSKSGKFAADERAQILVALLEGGF